MQTHGYDMAEDDRDFPHPSASDSSLSSWSSSSSCASSSRASSPVPIADDRPQDPMSGSSKATRRPRIHSKKSSFHTPSSSPVKFVVTPKAAGDVTSTPERTPRAALLTSSITPLHPLTEQDVWEDYITRAVDRADGNIDLASRNLTSIPSSIRDLSNLVVLDQTSVQEPSQSRTFSRISSAPASFASSSTPHTSSTRFGDHGRTPSAAGRADAFPSKEAEIKLWLRNNRVSSLPRNLFALTNLTVLSLQNNRLDHLPPLIGTLTSLTELNVANNRLTYLPAEITNLSLLKNLILTSNPFLPPPSAKKLSRTRHVRILSPLQHIRQDESRVPSLQEMCLQVLLAPSSPSASVSLQRRLISQNNLQAHYDDLDSWDIPRHLQLVLREGTVSGSSLKADSDVVSEEQFWNTHGENGHNGQKEETRNAYIEAAKYYPNFCLSPAHGSIPLGGSSASPSRASSKASVGSQPPNGRSLYPAARIPSSHAVMTPSATFPPFPSSSPTVRTRGSFTRSISAFTHPSSASRPVIAPLSPLSQSTFTRTRSNVVSQTPSLPKATLRSPSASIRSSVPHSEIPLSESRLPYVLHSESRMEWVHTIAGLPVSRGAPVQRRPSQTIHDELDSGSDLDDSLDGDGLGNAGRGGIPILWRGCQKGCLDFLEAEAGLDEGLFDEQEEGEEEEEEDGWGMGELELEDVRKEALAEALARRNQEGDDDYEELFGLGSGHRARPGFSPVTPTRTARLTSPSSSPSSSSLDLSSSSASLEDVQEETEDEDEDSLGPGASDPLKSLSFSTPSARHSR